MRVLVVVDMQKDFVDGALGSPEAQAIVPNVAAKVKEYTNIEDGLVVYTRDTHFDNYMDTAEGKYLPVSHCVFETEGWEIVPEVLNEEAAAVYVNKMTFGCNYLAAEINDPVEELGETIKSIEICGLCTDICVVSNALILKANFPEVPFTVDSACCAGVTPEKHKAALEVMRSCQIDVI